MEIDILSLFPDYFYGPFNESIIKQAQKKGLLSINQTNIRTFSEDKHSKVDDRPYGGGPGMVLMPEPTEKAILATRKPDSKIIYLSPQGALLTPEKCQELAKNKHLVLLCGHYEGIDERIIQKHVDEEISIGDFVLTNGCLAAIVLIDALVRFIPGVLGSQESAVQDSFSNHLLDYPHYTRPENFQGLNVPSVLLEGNHQKIQQWRLLCALEKTRQRRPDLYVKYLVSQEERQEVKSKNETEFIEGKIHIPVKDKNKTNKFFQKVLGQNYLEFNFFQQFHWVNHPEPPNSALVFHLSVESVLFQQTLHRLKRLDCVIHFSEKKILFRDLDNYLWQLNLNF